MRKRSKSREYVLQCLYQREISGESLGSSDISLEDFWNQLEDKDPQEIVSEEIRKFSDELIKLIVQHDKEIDEWIDKCSDHWKLDRMAVVDRNILRLGTCELLYCEDTPAKVSINESIELAKRYGDSESSKFVNGVLDQIAKQNNRTHQKD